MIAGNANNTLTVYYWNLNFRGHFIYCLLDYLNVSYNRGSVPDLLALKNAAPHEAQAKFMAPPLLHDKENNIFLGQTPSIVTYLARKHGLCPQDPIKMALAEKCIHDCSDVLAGITRNNGSMMWTQEDWTNWSTTRFVRWLQIFEATAMQQGLKETEGFFLGTPSATFADTILVATLKNMEFALGSKIATILRTHSPRVMALTDRIVASSVKLSARFAPQDGSVPYCGGYIEKSIRSVLAGGDGSTDI
jgi:glutathione S-transferase